MNDDGCVVWEGQDGNDWEVHMYNGGNSVQLTDNDVDDRAPQINNNGDVVWHSNQSDSEIFFYNGSNIIQLTNNTDADTYPKINDRGDVVWQCNDGNDSEIFIANSVIEPVPTISEWGMIIMSLLFIVLGMVVIKNQQLPELPTRDN